jgi:hypothetical protein
MSQPQDTSHAEQQDSQPVIVYVPIPFTPSQSGDPRLQQQWQQSLFWQMNPLLSESSQATQTSSFPFPTSIVPTENPPLTLSARVNEKLTAKEIEEDREFERKKRNSEGNLGKLILCISYCYALGVLTWFVGRDYFRNPVVASNAQIESPAVRSAIDNSINSSIAATQISQQISQNALGKNNTNVTKFLTTLPIANTPAQNIPVPPPPATTIATNTIPPNNKNVAIANNPSQVTITPSPKVTTPKEVKPIKTPTVLKTPVKTPAVVKIPNVPSIQIAAPTPTQIPNNNNDLGNVPPPPPTQTEIAIQPNQMPVTPLAMVDTKPSIAKDGYLLMGVLEAGELSGALFQIDGIVQNIKINETIGNSGWKLVAIVNGRATIARNSQTRSIGVEEQI